MLSGFKNLIRFCVRPLTKRIWLRVDSRIRAFAELRFQSLEMKEKDLQLSINELQLHVNDLQLHVNDLQLHTVDLEKKSTDLQANFGDLQVRTETLEKKWENHVTTFLQATSIVVSFERELAHLKDVVFSRDGANSSDASREMIPLKGKSDAGEDL